jgi:hypothetical protein
LLVVPWSISVIVCDWSGENHLIHYTTLQAVAWIIIWSIKTLG